MANTKIPTGHDADKLVCDECGQIHDDDADDEFAGRMDMLDAALEGIEDPGMELTLISQIAGEFLAKFPAEARAKMRAGLIEAIDEDTTAAVIASCDA